MDSVLQYSSDDDTDEVVPDLELKPYSENFAGQRNMNSVYVSIPLRPSLTAATRLRADATKALAHLKAHQAHFYNRYRWEVVGNASRSPNPGIYDMTGLHISLMLNHEGREHQGLQFEQGVTQAVSQLQFDPDLTKASDEAIGRTNALNQILFQGSTKMAPKPQVPIIIKPQIRLVQSVSSSAVFLVVDVQPNPVIEALESVIEENRMLTGLQPQHAVTSNTHHISIATGIEVAEGNGFDEARDSLAAIDNLQLSQADLGFDRIQLFRNSVMAHRKEIVLPLSRTE